MKHKTVDSVAFFASITLIAIFCSGLIYAVWWAVERGKGQRAARAEYCDTQHRIVCPSIGLDVIASPCDYSWDWDYEGGRSGLLEFNGGVYQGCSAFPVE